jgi:hypothetical protein
LSRLREKGKLILPKRKYDAIVDVVSTSLEVYSAAYRDSAQIKKYWVECGNKDTDSYLFQMFRRYCLHPKCTGTHPFGTNVLELSQLYSERPSQLMTSEASHRIPLTNSAYL